jgi:hypothetical protein
MKTNKIIIETAENVYKYTLKQEFNMPLITWKNKCIKLVEEGEVIIHIYDGNLFHICKYCGQITAGSQQDLLCKGCKELFGHKYFSEL